MLLVLGRRHRRFKGRGSRLEHLLDRCEVGARRAAGGACRGNGHVIPSMELRGWPILGARSGTGTPCRRSWPSAVFPVAFPASSLSSRANPWHYGRCIEKVFWVMYLPWHLPF